MNDDANLTLISEDWLRDVGFKWHQFDRQPNKQWLLWVGQACGQWGCGTDDLGVELAPGSYDAVADDTDGWFCWLRSDASHRYSRFLHIRRLRTRAEVIRLVEGLTGQDWNPELHLYGSIHHPKHAERLRADRQRLDLVLAENGHPWYPTETDESRGRPLREHLEAAVKNGGAK
jgi:hypothetical protein